MKVMDNEKLNYMKSMVLYKEEDKMKLCIDKIVNDFRDEGFFEDEIFDYMKNILLEGMLKEEFDKWNDIRNRLI